SSHPFITPSSPHHPHHLIPSSSPHHPHPLIIPSLHHPLITRIPSSSHPFITLIITTKHFYNSPHNARICSDPTHRTQKRKKLKIIGNRRE
ncbi:MAG: hypothetical protein SOY49_04165, partial [Prevotella sp.]|nr:hypothetical protein [Prevotella sp.]